MLKRKFLYLFLLALVCMPMGAQTTIIPQKQNGIRLSRIDIHKAGHELSIAFRATVDKDAVKSGCTKLLLPTLNAADNNRALPYIAIQTERGRKAEARHEYAAKDSLSGILSGETFYVSPGKSVAYFATLPYEDWMANAALTMNSYTVGCGSANKTLADDTLLAALRWRADTVYVTKYDTIWKETLVAAPHTTGDKLAQKYRFVAPSTEFRLADGLTDTELRNALFVRFRVGGTTIDRYYMDNVATIDTLLNVISELSAAGDSRVSKVFIAGFTSPEGSYAVNQRLGLARANAMKEYILSHTTLKNENIEIFNGATDWQGLRMLVADSNMPNKRAVLHIIDTVPVWDSRTNTGRLGTLMRLDGGVPYQYIKEHFFEQMRNAAYIRVYFEDNEK
jgi:outer membrane protein OmpA-like peptidoglycan-associated protein